MDHPLQSGIRQTLRLDAAHPEDLERAAAILRSGGTVAFPTETVYGLAANAFDPAAVEKIFAAKRRPHWDPLIVHLCDLAMLEEVTPLPLLPLADHPAEPNAHPHPDPILRTARTLIHRFWPGPLTLLLPRSARIPDAVTAGRPLVALRMPSHPVARRLIERAGVPLAAPSANLFGHTSPTSAAHVLEDLDGRIDAVLDGGPTQVGLESTVLDPCQSPIVIYRQGAVTLEMIQAHLGPDSAYVFVPEGSSDEPESLPSPGVGLRHYAPAARLVLIDEADLIREAFDLLVDNFWQEDERVGVMLPDNWPAPGHGITFRWGPWENKEELAHRLFEGLRDLDRRGATVILCPLPSPEGIGEAIRDRLEKAARQD